VMIAEGVMCEAEQLALEKIGLDGFTGTHII
jgi:hypothetical protein